MKSTRLSCGVLILMMVLGGTCFAQYAPDGLFQFSRYWQQEAGDETSYELNLNPDARIDAQDLLLLIEEWRTEIPAPTPTPTSTPPKFEEITVELPGLPEDATPLILVRITAGSFLMGSSDDSTWSWCDSCEQPVHEVRIEHDFYMGKHEITQAQWTALMAILPATAYGVGDNYPVYNISWNDCQDFITELNKLQQGIFRLPSEAEWEYACRAGATTRFYFGDSVECATSCEDCAAGLLSGNRSDYMWYCGDNRPFGAKPVGGKLPNAFGLYDMHGNVWEWCQDLWHEGYLGAPIKGSAWEISPSSYRVMRGGFWNNQAFCCRAAHRFRYAPDFIHYGSGFRVVRTQ